jgi:hypothetical protein
MHAIVFEGTTEEARHALAGDRLQLYGAADLDTLASGDVVWIATRMEDDRGMPALCGRLVISRIERPRGNVKLFEPAYCDRDRRAIMQFSRSERCQSLECPFIRTWEIWRSPFGGLRTLSDEQGRSLEEHWEKAAGRGAPRQP